VYGWDLNGDGAYDDSALVSPVYTYAQPGTHTVGLKVTDSQGASGTATLTIQVDNTPPTATIATPGPSLTWKVGDVIAFSGGATDPQQGTLPASALTWTLACTTAPRTATSHAVEERLRPSVEADVEASSPGLTLV
jgi:PKD repeat protein